MAFNIKRMANVREIEQMETIDDVSDTPLEDINSLGARFDIEETLPQNYFLMDENFDKLGESGKLLRKYLEYEGFGKQHIIVFDNWFANVLEKTIVSKTLKLVKQNKETEEREIRPENLTIIPPRYTKDARRHPLTPKYAREQGLTYGVDLYVDMVERYQGQETKRVQSVFVGNIPIALKSKYCILRGKTPEELEALGEDPKDPGGYYIIEGVEKVVLLQEGLVLNKIILMKTQAKLSASIRLTVGIPRGSALIELTVDKKTNSVIKIRLPSLKGAKGEQYKSLNILRIYRIFGIDYDGAREMIGTFLKPERKEKALYKLTRTIADSSIKTNDIDIMIDKMDKGNLNLTDAQKRGEIMKVFEADLFPHVNDLQGFDATQEERESYIYTAKMNLLSIMTARYLEYMAGLRPTDDRDSWSNKRTEGGGRMMEGLFRNAWRTLLAGIQNIIKKQSIMDVQTAINKSKFNLIAETFHDSFITSNWGVKKGAMKNNIAQTLVRENVISTFSHINTIDVPISRTDRQQNLRLVQNSQWGFVDPVSTTEGENAGILKNMSITAKVSIERSDAAIIRMLIGNYEGEGLVSTKNPYDPERNDKIMVNGKFIGWGNANIIHEFLLEQRRGKIIPEDVSIIHDEDWIYVEVSPSRLVRPLLIVNKDTQQLIIDEKGMRDATIPELLRSGVMEYVSCWEQEYIKVAPTVDDIINRLKLIDEAEKIKADALILIKNVEEGVETEITLEDAQKRLEDAQESLDKVMKKAPYTHCELDPQSILSVASALIPWPNHNQAPRNTYQVGMGKQALGVYHDNHRNRMTDGKTKLLAFPQKPMVNTEMFDLIGLGTKGQGQNVTIAFLAFPFTEEDAFVFKREFLDNGGFRIYKYLTFKTTIKSGGNIFDKLVKPVPKQGENGDRFKYIQQGDNLSPLNGLPMIGAPLKQGDCVIGKIHKVEGEVERNDSVFLRVGDEGVVEKVLVTSNKITSTVIVKLRTMRVPEEGDKYAPRNAQKGTIGLVMSEIDLPKNANGIAPDIIVNPHCFVGDTEILLKNGMSRRLTDMKYDGGDNVWSWNKERHVFVTSSTVGYESKGVQKIICLILSDGRKLKCTPTHKFPVVEVNETGEQIFKSVPAKDISENMYIFAGIDGVLDNPSEEERTLEKEWLLNTENYTFSMKTSEERDKALSYARLLGMVCTDGCLSLNPQGARGHIVVGTEIDADSILDDIFVITNKRPTITKHHSDVGGDTMGMALPVKLARSMASLEGMTVGRRTTQVPLWPQFLMDDNCPKSIIREFLGGAFGGDGWAPYIVKSGGKTHVSFKPPAFSQSSNIKFETELVIKMNMMKLMLERVGVEGVTIAKTKKYMQGEICMGTSILQLPNTLDFGEKVGFRYCVQKMQRMAAYQSYLKYLTNVKRQNDFVLVRATELYDKKICKTLKLSLDRAREDLLQNEAPLNEYYSNSTMTQLNNRRRSARSKNLLKWDYNFIEDAEEYLRKIGVYHWFRTEDDKAGAPYIIDKNDDGLPCFLLKLSVIKELDEEQEVFDIGVRETHTFVAHGVATRNCLPSRMTISYIMELLASKYGAMRGVEINGTAFHPFELNKYRESLKEYGMDEFGYETLYSGITGERLDAKIYMGPVYFQALKHHVKDKIQSRGFGQIKAMHRQPAKGRGVHGGLRFGEMERDAGISHGASAFLRERLLFASDEYKAAFCIKCGAFAVNNPNYIKDDPTNLPFMRCKMCNGSEFGQCVIPYSFKLLVHLLAVMGIYLRPEFETSDQYARRIFGHEPISTDIDMDIQDIDEDAHSEEEETFNNDPIYNDNPEMDYSHFDL